MVPLILNKIELDIASYLYNQLLKGEITREQASLIAKNVLENFPENTPDVKLEKPLVKFSYTYPFLSPILKQYLEEIREQLLENLREQKISYHGLKPVVFLRKSLLSPPLRSGLKFIFGLKSPEDSFRENKRKKI